MLGSGNESAGNGFTNECFIVVVYSPYESTCIQIWWMYSKWKLINVNKEMWFLVCLFVNSYICIYYMYTNGQTHAYICTSESTSAFVVISRKELIGHFKLLLSMNNVFIEFVYSNNLFFYFRNNGEYTGYWRRRHDVYTWNWWKWNK